MLELTASEVAFLKKNSLSVNHVYDGRGQSVKVKYDEAKRLGKTIVIGNPCKKANHRLRDLANHCAQCSPSVLHHQKIYETPGYVYVAGSLQGKVLKIGCSTDINDRERTLNSEPYAGFNDWRMIANVKVQRKGDLENRVLARLNGFQASFTNIRSGREVRQTEIRSCSAEVAIEALQYEVGKNQEHEIEIKKIWKIYNW